MKLQFGIATLFLFIGSAVVASASTIQLGINGEAQVSNSAINFGQYPNGAPYTPYPGYGTFQVSLVNAGVFLKAGVTPGETGNIESLSMAAQPVGTMLNPVPGTTPPFMTFDTGGANLQLYLTVLEPGSTAGPFTVTDTQSGAVVAFAADGFVYDTLTAQQEDFTGTFSATFDGTSASQLFSSLPEDSPFTATFSATFVPEPSALLLMGLGVGALGLLGRGRFRK